MLRSIHCRDEVIEKRQRLGDFEGDTVIGKNHKGALLTLVERKSLYVHIVQTRTTAKTISCALACLRSSHAYSVTFDNGKEFSEHRRITDAGIETYFADPYKSIQREIKYRRSDNICQNPHRLIMFQKSG